MNASLARVPADGSWASRSSQPSAERRKASSASARQYLRLVLVERGIMDSGAEGGVSMDAQALSRVSGRSKIFMQDAFSSSLALLWNPGEGRPRSSW